MTERLACVVLVDGRGRLLLQERDEHAPRAPGQWGMTGGHVEEGESFTEAAYRELAEETGLRLEPGHLYRWREEELTLPDASEPSHLHVYVGRVDGVEDADIVVGEGRRIVFVDPERVPDLDLAASAAHVLPAFLASSTYTRLAGFAAHDDAPERRRFSSVLLLDARGWLLLQERDEHPVIDPGCWGFVGGGVEGGEDYERAAYRELAEETGVRLETGLRLHGVFDVFHRSLDSLDEFSLWVGRTDLTDADIVVGEGRQIVFVDPATVTALPLTASCRIALPGFLASETYRELTS